MLKKDKFVNVGEKPLIVSGAKFSIGHVFFISKIKGFFVIL
jgi:hypothetical protein